MRCLGCVKKEGHHKGTLFLVFLLSLFNGDFGVLVEAPEWDDQDLIKNEDSC